ncbi:doublesex- and mab-3-related transcription factor C1-like [Lemur catta]|uniref:doublesex- and mab-3-related transcription factor C1-like n=1 Tax=Lemur catta TaxID=9447 RepID=UPI001E26A512|nr:doublesex- and mab-3-related transcription factor C1-like [Lemur catta]
MEPKEIPAVPCCPSDSECTTGRETGAPWGIELGLRRAIGRCDRCHNHGITTQIRGHKHFCLFQACKCHNCALFSEHRRILPAVSALKRGQRARLKRHLARGLIRSMAAPPKGHTHAKNLPVEGGVLTGKESNVLQPEAHIRTTPKEESSPGALLLDKPPEHLSLPCTPATLEQQLTVSLSGEPHGPLALLSICSTLILQPCATLDPLLLQPQAPKASDQAAVSASLEWQRKLEAAEALLTLRDSSQAPSDSISLHQPCGPPAPAGDKGLQPPSPSLHPRPASSLSLPIGHLGCISLSS